MKPPNFLKSPEHVTHDRLSMVRRAVRWGSGLRPKVWHCSGLVLHSLYLLLVALLAWTGPVEAQNAKEANTTRQLENVEVGTPDLGPMRTISFETDEGTWIDIDLSPDGRTILFSMLGDIYTLPIDGGEARLLLGGRAFEGHPRYSPDGRQISFLSDRSGWMSLWVMDADGTNLRQVSNERSNILGMQSWTPDGEYILIPKVFIGGPEKLWVYHRDGGTGFALETSPGRTFGPEPSPDGRYIYFGLSPYPPSQSQIHRFDRQTGETMPLTSGSEASFRPKLSPDGRWLAYGRRQDGATTLRLRDLRIGAERELITPITRDDSEGAGFWDILPHYTFTADSHSILILREGKIHRVDIESGTSRVIPFRAHVALEVPETPVRVANRISDGDLSAKILRWLNISGDGSRAVFSALGKVWVTELPNGKPRRLTVDSWREYAPSLSPDGKSVAYVAWSDSAYGALMVAPVKGGAPRRLTSIPARYTSPAWSPDGSTVAFVRGAGSELRQAQPNADEYWELMTVSAAGGEARRVTYMEPTRHSLRYYPQLSFSADGSRIFYTGHDVWADSLVSIGINDQDHRVHMRFTGGHQVIPSPDGKHVAVLHRDDLYILPFPPVGTEPFTINLKTPVLPVKHISAEGASYVTWLDEETVAWSFTNRVYMHRLGADSVKHIAEIELTVPREKPKGRIAFVDARIATMRGDEVIERGTIIINDNRIMAVGPSDRVKVPADATVIQARGTTIVPGLIDTHSHLEHVAHEYFPEQRWEYAAALAYGVTTSFDPSASNLDVFAQAELVEAGETLGPRIYSTGEVVFGAPLRAEGVRITGIEDARHVVRRQKDFGAVMIKQYGLPNRDQRQWLAQAARELGIRITAEGGREFDINITLVMDGYTAFEHSFAFTPLYRDVIELMARTGTHYTANLTTAHGGPKAGEYFYSITDMENGKLRRFAPRQSLNRLRRWTFFPEEERSFHSQAKDVAAILRAGGRVDTGAHGVRQGLGTHWEIWTFAEGGLPPLEALRAATWMGAAKIGLEDDLGSLGEGMLADFLVLDANPLEDIRNTEKIRYVVKNGFVYDAESLARLWPERRDPLRFFWQTEEERRRYAPPSPATNAMKEVAAPKASGGN